MTTPEGRKFEGNRQDGTLTGQVYCSFPNSKDELLRKIKQILSQEAQEDRYYLDLYGELAQLRPRRLWSGAGGLSAVNYKNGRKILEFAAESGLTSIAAGLESISAKGQKQSGAWKKLTASCMIRSRARPTPERLSMKNSEAIGSRIERPDEERQSVSTR